MGKMFTFSSAVHVIYSLVVFRDYINKLWPPVRGVPMKITKHFSEIETSNELMRHLGLQHY